MPTVMINGAIRQYDKGTTFESIVKEYQPKYNYSIALVYFNGKMRELSKRLERDGALSFITTSDNAGHNAYIRTAQMMLVKAVSEILGEAGKDARIKIEFSLGNACFCSILGGIRSTPDLAEKIEKKMRFYVEKNIPVTKKTYPIDDAVELFRHQGMKDKEKLFHFRRSSTVNVYRMDGYSDYFYGYMLPATGYVRHFKVQAYMGGLLLILPRRGEPDVIRDFIEQPSLFEQLMMSTKWGDLVNISTVADLNEQICGGSISDMILVQEALQERRIGEIALQIHERERSALCWWPAPVRPEKRLFPTALRFSSKHSGCGPISSIWMTILSTATAHRWI